jgi:hypothetical protein
MRGIGNLHPPQCKSFSRKDLLSVRGMRGMFSLPTRCARVRTYEGKSYRESPENRPRIPRITRAESCPYPLLRRANLSVTLGVAGRPREQYPLPAEETNESVRSSIPGRDARRP